MQLSIEPITQHDLIVSSGLTMDQLGELLNVNRNQAFSYKIERKLLTHSQVKDIILNSQNSLLRHFIGKESEVSLSIHYQFKSNNKQSQLILKSESGIELWHNRARRIGVVRRGAECLDVFEDLTRKAAIKKFKEYYL